MRLAFSRSRRLGAVLAAAVLPFALAACADNNSGEAYQGYIGRWVGKPVGQLTADWGPASYETAERGLRELQYNYSEAISYGERPIRITCTTKFFIDNAGIVQSADADGNACSTKNLGPESRR
jgi:hypothetical protein